MEGRLVDSTIWIDLSHGKPDAAAFLIESRRRGRVVCSVINVMEVLIGAVDARHQRELSKMFRAVDILSVTEDDGWQALRIIKANARSSGTGVSDALIAAAAIREGLTLATHNLRDFAGVAGLKTMKPY